MLQSLMLVQVLKVTHEQFLAQLIQLETTLAYDNQLEGAFVAITEETVEDLRRRGKCINEGIVKMGSRYAAIQPTPCVVSDTLLPEINRDNLSDYFFLIKEEIDEISRKSVDASRSEMIKRIKTTIYLNQLELLEKSCRTKLLSGEEMDYLFLYVSLQYQASLANEASFGDYGLSAKSSPFDNWRQLPTLTHQVTPALRA